MNHPLTDEIIEDILLNRYWWELEPCQDALRAAADWQLEQVLKFMEKHKQLFGGSGMIFILKDAMRLQEDN